MNKVDEKEASNGRNSDGEARLMETSEHHRLKSCLAATRATMLSHAQELDAVRNQLRKLEAENQTQRQLADQWLGFQGSRMSRFHRAYIAIHHKPIIGSVVKAMKQPFIALLCRKS